MLMDGEFAPLMVALEQLKILLNTTAANEHVPLVECMIRVLKERTRATRHTLPFSCIPRIMLVELVLNSCFWLNAFPPKGGVSETLSHRAIVLGRTLDYKCHCSLPFGSYVQAHKEPTPMNSLESRTVGAIAMGPTGNIQGSHKFLNLCTAKKVNR